MMAVPGLCCREGVWSLVGSCFDGAYRVYVGGEVESVVLVSGLLERLSGCSSCAGGVGGCGRGPCHVGYNAVAFCDGEAGPAVVRWELGGWPSVGDAFDALRSARRLSWFDGVVRPGVVLARLLRGADGVVEVCFRRLR